MLVVYSSTTLPIITEWSSIRLDAANFYEQLFIDSGMGVTDKTRCDNKLTSCSKVLWRDFHLCCLALHHIFFNICDGTEDCAVMVDIHTPRGAYFQSQNTVLSSAFDDQYEASAISDPGGSGHHRIRALVPDDAILGLWGALKSSCQDHCS